ncbi:SulP family inorganic anion transporter [Paenibacillus sp. WLX1005]|uniref:SulP family inorganic anion transporter n=1 Tax=Paenibacillus sp. WLX1005 TaxID=3243766 RepID=UPI00398417D2
MNVRKLAQRFGFNTYGRKQLQRDLIAGCTVGIIAIPLGMAFAIASGVKPETGLYTTIIAGILISLFGGSRFQIGGPTGAFIPVLLAIVLQYGYDKLLVAGFLAGILLVVMGLLRLGALIRFIPRPVTVGFTAGIAVTIFTGQIGSFLGLTGLQRHESFLLNMKEIGLHLHTINLYSVAIALLCLTALLLIPRVLPRIPASLVGLLTATLFSVWLWSGKVATIGSAYGEIPAALPGLHGLDLSWSTIVLMIQPACIIALLGSIESLLSAVVADEMSGTRHRANRELIGQGIANMITPLFGGIPATGAIARTATNIKSGAFSKVSGIVHGLVVLLVLLLLAPYASAIPLSSMAPILMVVAWNMSERRSFAAILRLRNGDSLVLLVTFLLTVGTTLTLAVEVGLALSMIMFVYKSAAAQQIRQVVPDHQLRHGKVAPLSAHAGDSNTMHCERLSIFTLQGPLFFGSVNPFEQPEFVQAYRPEGVLLLRMGRVSLIDASGEARLRTLHNQISQHGGRLLLSGLVAQPLHLLKRSGLLHQIGEQCCFDHTGEAISAALQTDNRTCCINCAGGPYRECRALCTNSDRLSDSSERSVSAETAIL